MKDGRVSKEKVTESPPGGWGCLLHIPGVEPLTEFSEACIGCREKERERERKHKNLVHSQKQCMWI